MSEFSIGVNAPPFHCGCRGTTIPYFDDEFTQNEKRAYRGEDGKTHYTSAKTYKEWKEEFVKESYEKAPKTVDIEEKIKYNKEKVLSKYLGKEIVDTDNQSVREWYVANVSDIPNQIDKSKTKKEQAKQTFELRNKYKREARIAMSDKETAEQLEKERPVKSFDELLADKMKRKGLSEEEALEDIIKTASKTNADVNKEFGL